MLSAFCFPWFGPPLGFRGERPQGHPPQGSRGGRLGIVPKPYIPVGVIPLRVGGAGQVGEGRAGVRAGQDGVGQVGVVTSPVGAGQAE